MSGALTLRFITQSQIDLRRLTNELTDMQRQMSTQVVAHDLQSLGGASSRLLNAKAMMAQADSRNSVLGQLQARFGVQGAALGQVSEAATLLSQSIREAVSANDGRGIATELSLSFDSIVGALNETWNGQPMFAGERQGAGPVKISTLAELQTAVSTDDMFDEAARHQVVDAGTGAPIVMAAKASELSEELFNAMRDLQFLLGSEGIGQPITNAQQTALQAIADRLTAEASKFTNEEGRAGQLQKRFEAESVRLTERSDLIKKEIGEQVDADMGEVSMRLSALTLQYEASAKTFAELSKLSLLNYL
jgi:flagellar hook-associated protein 3 FlgL